jgi:hypothetical protein
MLPMSEGAEPVPQSDEARTTVPPADEFSPPADEGARARRVRGRKAKRVPQPTLLEEPEPEAEPSEPTPTPPEPATPEEPEPVPPPWTGQPEPAQSEPAEPEPTKPESTKPESTKPESTKPGTTKPEQTKDDTDAGWGETHDESAYDRYLREQRPPHWGHD